MLLSLTGKSNGISERHHIFFLCLPLPFLFQLRQQYRHLLAHLRLLYSCNSCCRTCWGEAQEASAMPLLFCLAAHPSQVQLFDRPYESYNSTRPTKTTASSHSFSNYPFHRKCMQNSKQAQSSSRQASFSPSLLVFSSLLVWSTTASVLHAYLLLHKTKWTLPLQATITWNWTRQNQEQAQMKTEYFCLLFAHIDIAQEI